MSERISDIIFDILKEIIQSKIDQVKTDDEKKAIIDSIASLDLHSIVAKSITKLSESVLQSLIQGRYERVLDFRAEEDEFLAQQKQKWNHAFASSEALYILGVEFAEECATFISHLSASENAPIQWRYTAVANIF